ncbi:MAG: helix-hairpin-helix domain-containing protein [Candidatus Aenigmarchaeota archaeon]|nr:helix-hairpin-helix domain-containing protein [Candidatus Aenigmarchaeota archaeon]
MIKRDKWHFLTTQVGYDKYTVPVYEASAKNRCVPLLKTLMSSSCSNNCKFCMFRCERRTRRERWEPEDLAKITYKLWKAKKIAGLFLSSSVERDPDHTVERMVQTIEILRKIGFTAYIHARIMPGTSRELIKRCVLVSDRVGINVELPSRDYYEDMKLYLNFKQDVIKRLEWTSKEVQRIEKEGKCRAGLDSQLIIGASDESDREIIEVSDWLYHELKARRVYYSAFEPVKNTPLENKKPENPLREYRLYQASFLIRDYGFRVKDFVFKDYDRLDLSEDPKFSVAKENELSVNINNASFEELIRVPGIGIKTAGKILEKRPIKDISLLKSLGVNLKKAIPFIELSGIHQLTLTKWVN